MSREKKIEYCVYCGAKLIEGNVYCPNCGKLVVKIKSGEELAPEKSKIVEPISKGKVVISRKCSGCGSIITSPVLVQCPICNTMLEKIPETKETAPINAGFVFTDKKLEPEQSFLIKKDSWNLREGLRVFQTCVLTFIILQLLISMTLLFQTVSKEFTLNLNIFTIMLGQTPEIVFGIYPLWYIYSKNHDLRKLGFSSSIKKFAIAIIIGIIGVFGLLLINNLSSYLFNFFSEIGIDISGIQASLEKQYQVIRNADLVWVICLLFLVGLGAAFTEITFRGVFQNTLKVKFGNENNGKFLAILISALAYSLLYLLLTFSIGIIFFILNFLMFLLLGFLYEINENIYNSIIASVVYNVLLIILIVYF